jgi:hypothetical protein
MTTVAAVTGLAASVQNYLTDKNTHNYPQPPPEPVTEQKRIDGFNAPQNDSADK